MSPASAQSATTPTPTSHQPALVSTNGGVATAAMGGNILTHAQASSLYGNIKLENPASLSHAQSALLAQGVSGGGVISSSSVGGTTTYYTCNPTYSQTSSPPQNSSQEPSYGKLLSFILFFYHE